jgi:hypothetical protein
MTLNHVAAPAEVLGEAGVLEAGFLGMTSGAGGFFLYICTYSIYVIYAIYLYKAV